MGHSRMCVWLADLQPENRESLLEFFGEPRARGEATDEECDLLLDRQEQSLEKNPDVRTEPGVRR